MKAVTSQRSPSSLPYLFADKNGQTRGPRRRSRRNKISRQQNPGRLTRIQWDKCLEVLPPCLLLCAMVWAHPHTQNGGRTTAMHADNAAMASLKVRNEFLFFLKTKLNFELPPFVRNSVGGDARKFGINPWRRQHYLFVCLFVCSFVCPFACSGFARNKIKIPK